MSIHLYFEDTKIILNKNKSVLKKLRRLC